MSLGDSIADIVRALGNTVCGPLALLAYELKPACGF